MRLRKIHRWAGLILVVWIINASLTGLLRANATALYWSKRPSRETVSRLVVPAVGIDRALAAARKALARPAAMLDGLELKTFLGRTVYRIGLKTAGKPSFVLVDALSGEVLSPLPEKTAETAARFYVPEDTALKEAEFLPSFRARKATESRPAYRFLFDDARHTEVFIDRQTGQMLEILDQGRRFGIWMIRLHELDFAGMRRPGLTLLGMGTILISLTGLGLALSGRRRKTRRQKSTAGCV